MYWELKRNEQLMVDDAIALFREDPLHPSLANHPLWRNLYWCRSITAAPDLRVVFTEKWGYVEVTLLRVWPHDKVYR